MKPIFTTIANRHLMIIPDSDAHLDGHVVLTYTYSIYLDRFGGSGQYVKKKERKLHLEIKNDPTYCGFITFEQPGRIFNYDPDGPVHLSGDEIVELIEVISHYRDTPSLWILE